MHQEHYNEIRKGSESWNAYVKAHRRKELEWAADLRAADLESIDLSNADLKAADLSNAKLWGNNLSNADLESANLRGAVLRFADLRDADLRFANLQGADLESANLRRADLESANLRDADLRFANLRFANLWDANLRGAVLRGADLEGADLESANLRFANLRRANLRRANLEGANFSDIPDRPKDLLHQIAIAAHKTDGLNMGDWHTCETCHCVAGWAITLTLGGRELESKTSPDTAGRLLVPELAHLFYEDNETALEGLKKYLPGGGVG